MKRKLFFFFASLALYGTALAQQHYQFDFHDFKTNMPVVAQIQINGIEQTSTEIELGAFCGESIRGSHRIELIDGVYYRVWIQVYANSAFDTFTFKIYDHQTGMELENCSVVLYFDEEGYGTNANPQVFNFTTYTYNKNIIAYTPNAKDHYYLLASPIGEVAPDHVQYMTSNSFDLYYFDQAASDGLEWINIKDGNTNLMSGKGYLYANSGNVNISFNGTPYNGDGQVTLTKVANTQFEGWNLIGNPFAQNAFIGDRQFYVMNSSGTDIEVAQRNYIEPMEGIFVIAESNNESLTFSTTASTNNTDKGQIVINVTQERGASIDRAIVRFDEGNVLPKFMLNEHNTKLYIPQGNKDYAVVNSAAEGELPINFKAAKSGSYTLNVDRNDIEMDYLHLIDNMTGADVDLLVTPSYTFNAKTSDYASRFKLVFSANEPDGPSTGSGSFAYYNGSEWQISNMGEATLQVIDVTGRIVKNETISGNASISINETPGVYMMRLVSGNDVKVQKVVVR